MKTLFKKKRNKQRSYSHFMQSGGRMTKYNGQAASHAPCSCDLMVSPALGRVRAALSSVVSSLTSAVSATAVRSMAVAAVCAVPVIFSGTSAQAQGTETAPGSGIWDFTGAAVVTQAPTSATGGDLVVTTTAPFSVITAAGHGFSLSNAFGDGSISFMDANTSVITGANYGIFSRSLGTGAISINTTGLVTGTADVGIYASLANVGTDLTINAQGAVTGGRNGIYAYNSGSGLLSITTQAVTGGAAGDGIFGYNRGTDLTINAQGAVTGGRNGIFGYNDGSGAANITTQAVTGTGSDGIYVTNRGAALTINAQGAVIGDGRGIFGRNYGSGAVNITTLAVTGTTGNGIYGYAGGTDLTIIAQGAVIGGRNGIEGYNAGTGALNITTQAVTGTGRNGVSANGFGTNLTINAQGAVIGATAGVSARNAGAGALSMSITTQAVTGTGRNGIDASNYGTDLTINAQGAVIGADSGIYALNGGTGALIITTQAVTGTSRYGIYALNNGTDLTINAQGAVTGGYNGIEAYSSSTGTLSITANNLITGGTRAGIQTNTGTGGTTNITLNAGAVVSAASGQAIINDDGDSTITVNTGAAVNGRISLGDGSDELVFAGGDFSGVTLFDGGDDTATGDGFTDILRFAGSSGGVDSALFANWEQVVIGTGSTIAFTNNTLTVPLLTIRNGGVLNAGDMFTLTGNLANNGVLSMVNGTTIGRTTINGDYTGGGELQVDVDLAANTSDVLIVNGNVTGTTMVTANLVSPGGTVGGNILIVDVNGTSNADSFVLSNPFLGASAYALSQTGVDFFLNPVPVGFNPATSVYEAYPQILQELNTLTSLRERTSNRRGLDDTSESPLWTRIDMARSVTDAPTSTTDSTFETNRWRFQFGKDALIIPDKGSGHWILGINGNVGRATSDVSSPLGNGTIFAEGVGVGVTATWQDGNGLYVDAQAQFNWFFSNLSNTASGALVNSNDGSGQAFSLEIGKSFTMGDGWVMTPQAQLMTSTVDFANFIGPDAAAVALNGSDSLIGRLGMHIEHQKSAGTDEGSAGNDSRVYGLANLYSQFVGDSQVNVSGLNFDNQLGQWTGEIGLGASFSKDGGKTALFGEAAVGTSLEGFGDSYQVRGVLGVRLAY